MRNNIEIKPASIRFYANFLSFWFYYNLSLDNSRHLQLLARQMTTYLDATTNGLLASHVTGCWDLRLNRPVDRMRLLISASIRAVDIYQKSASLHLRACVQLSCSSNLLNPQMPKVFRQPKTPRGGGGGYHHPPGFLPSRPNFLKIFLMGMFSRSRNPTVIMKKFYLYCMTLKIKVKHLFAWPFLSPVVNMIQGRSWCRF